MSTQADKELRGTTFRWTALRSSRPCSECRELYGFGLYAWRPTHGHGGWTRDALLCSSCMNDLQATAARGHIRDAEGQR